MKVDLAFVAAILKQSVNRDRQNATAISGCKPGKRGGPPFRKVDGALVIIPTKDLSQQARIFGTFKTRHFLQVWDSRLPEPKLGPQGNFRQDT